MKKNSLSHKMRIRKKTSKSVLNRTSMSLNSYVHISPLTPWVPWGQSSYTLPHLLKDENLGQGNLLWNLACISIIFCFLSLEFGFKILDSSICPLMPGSSLKIICTVQLSELFSIEARCSQFSVPLFLTEILPTLAEFWETILPHG